MRSNADLLGYAITGAIVSLSLVVSLYHESKREKYCPSRLGFKWGYFVIYNTLFGNLFILGLLVFLTTNKNRSEGALTIILMTAVLFVAVFKAAQRRKWALIVVTVLSLNPVWMVINIFYLRNRWGEFTEEQGARVSRNTQGSASGGEIKNTISKD